MEPEHALVIFDLDGTLYRTESSFLETMMRTYRAHGVVPPPEREILALVGETFETFLEWLKPQGFAPAIQDLAKEIGETESAAIAERGEAYPAAVETLRSLRDSGCRLAICSNGDAVYVGAVLRRIGAADLFDRIMTFQDRKMPKPQMVAELLDQFRPAHAILVGDRYHDLEAGRANGCFVVGAAYGYARPGELDGANRIIRSLTELPAIVASLCEGMAGDAAS